jgi:type I restriction enzyme, R subunit
VKRLLRKYGYPPDLQDAAVQKVLQQAEAIVGRLGGMISPFLSATAVGSPPGLPG